MIHEEEDVEDDVILAIKMKGNNEKNVCQV